LKKPNLSSKYHVSFDTFILQPVKKGNKIETRVMERDGELTVPRKPHHIISKSCIYYGGSLQNATNSTTDTIGIRHKIPIIVAHDYGMPCIFLPTMSPSSEQNVWLAFHAINYFLPDDMGCVVHFENGQSILLNISVATMQRQYSYAALLSKNFVYRQKQLNRPSSFDSSEDD
jgi:competence protein ComK